MTEYELKKETDSFRRGYWDGLLFDGVDSYPDRPSPSDRVEYRRGYRVGRDDGYRSSGGRLPCRRP